MIKSNPKVSQRISDGVQKYRKILEEAKKKNLNEADTCYIINDMLGEILGYDKFFEVTSEHRVRGQYVDYAVKLNNQVKYFIEAKSIGTALSDQHLVQVINYAANAGVTWAILTNAVVWQIYFIEFKKPIDKQLLFEVDILDSKPLEQKIELFYLLSKESFLKDELKEYKERKLALSPHNIVSIILSTEMLEKIRKEIKTSTSHNFSLDEIRKFMIEEIIKIDVPLELIKKIELEKNKTASVKKVTVPSDNTVSPEPAEAQAV